MTKHTIRLRRPLLVVPLLGLCVLLSTGCASDKQVISQANQVHQSLEPAVITDAQMTGYIQQVGDRIIAAAQELDKQGFGPKSHKKEKADWMFDRGGMRFHFVNSKTVNAFTTGGNHMYIYTALLQMCKTEDELAAVMAHEFAHVYARHVQKGMNRQMYTMAGAGAAGLVGYAAGGKSHGQEYGSTFAGLAAAAGQYFGMSYTREDEDEADRLGFRFYAHAGWDPNKFGDFFQAMIDKGYDKPDASASDHPTLKSRVEKTRARVKNLPADASRWQRAPVAGPQQFRQIQERATQVARNMPDDQSLTQSKELLQALPRSCLTPRDQVDLPDQRAAQETIIQQLQARRAAQSNAAAQGQRR